MIDNELTVAEIIKALKICSTKGASCKDCPAFVKVDRSRCKQVLIGAVDIINRLQAKVEALQMDNKQLQSDYICANQNYEHIKERWQAEKEKVEIARQKVIKICRALKTAKAEAYKEFDELLKEDCLSYPLKKGDITMLVDVESYNNLLKELVGDNGNTTSKTEP